MKLNKNEKGITLIALVVTIIVILVLAGISIAMLTGENGIITNAITANSATRGGEVKERVALEVSNNKILEYTNGTQKTKAEVIEELAEEGKLTAEEVALLTDEENPTDVITIGGITINFGLLPSSSALTIGSVYTDDMIGQSITYSANGCSEWIVIGPELDSSGNRTGNVLITSKDPIADGFTLNGTAKAWLYYDKKSGETGYDETDDNGNPFSLNKACSVYSGTIQGKTINARSITLQDINYAVGFTEPTDFKTYTFGTENDFENQKVDYYYPSLLGANRTDSIPKYFVKAGETLESTIPSQNFKAKCYYYYNDGEGYKYYYENTNREEVATTLTKIENMQYVIGETGESYYVVASRSVYVFSGGAGFYVANVNEGHVSSGDGILCASYADHADDRGGSNAVPVRPVAVLPSDIEVEEVSSGVYDIAE